MTSWIVWGASGWAVAMFFVWALLAAAAREDDRRGTR